MILVQDYLNKVFLYNKNHLSISSALKRTIPAPHLTPTRNGILHASGLFLCNIIMLTELWICSKVQVLHKHLSNKEAAPPLHPLVMSYNFQALNDYVNFHCS